MAYIVCLSFLFVTCGSKNQVPGSYLQPEKMEAVLWDMMRSDQFLSDYVFARDTGAKKGEQSFAMYAKIFSIHKISAEQFKSSFEYYHQHADMLKAVMDSISKRALYPQHLPDTVSPVPLDKVDAIQDSMTIQKADTLLRKPQRKPTRQ